jgi:hypothetical protein
VAAESLPTPLPVLVGKQYIQHESATGSGSVPAPTGVGATAAGHHRAGQVAALPAPQAEPEVTTVEISAEYHASGQGRLPAPTSVVVGTPGFNNAGGVGVLPRPIGRSDVSHREFRVFCPQFELEHFRFPRTGLVGELAWGVSVYKANGEWHEGRVIDPEQIDGLERLYRGGRRYVLTDAEEAELSAAGYATNIITEVS